MEENDRTRNVQNFSNSERSGYNSKKGHRLSFKRSKSVPPPNRGNIASRIEVRTLGHENLQGFLDTILLDTWTHIVTAPSSPTGQNYRENAHHNQLKTPEEENGYKIIEWSKIPYESVEFFPRPPKYEHKATHKQLLQPFIYDKLRDPGDDTGQYRSTRSPNQMKARQTETSTTLASPCPSYYSVHNIETSQEKMHSNIWLPNAHLYRTLPSERMLQMEMEHYERGGTSVYQSNISPALSISRTVADGNTGNENPVKLLSNNHTDIFITRIPENTANVLDICTYLPRVSIEPVLLIKLSSEDEVEKKFETERPTDIEKNIENNWVQITSTCSGILPVIVEQSASCSAQSNLSSSTQLAEQKSNPQKMFEDKNEFQQQKDLTKARHGDCIAGQEILNAHSQRGLNFPVGSDERFAKEHPNFTPIEQTTDAKSEYYPMGAASIYSEVEKNTFCFPLVKFTQDTSSTSELVFLIIPKNLTYTHSSTDKDVKCIQNQHVADCKSSDEQTDMDITVNHLLVGQNVNDIISPQLISIPELPLIFQFTQASGTPKIWNIIEGASPQIDGQIKILDMFPFFGNAAGVSSHNPCSDSSNCLIFVNQSEEEVYSKADCRNEMNFADKMNPLATVSERRISKGGSGPDLRHNPSDAEVSLHNDQELLTASTCSKISSNTDHMDSTASTKWYTVGLDQSGSSAESHTLKRVDPIPTFGHVHLRPSKVERFKENRAKESSVQVYDDIEYYESQWKREAIKNDTTSIESASNQVHCSQNTQEMTRHRYFLDEGEKCRCGDFAITHAGLMADTYNTSERPAKLDILASDMQPLIFPTDLLVPSILINIPIQTGIHYEMDLGEPHPMRLGIHTYSIKNEIDGQNNVESTRNWCLPFLKLRRKISYSKR